MKIIECPRDAMQGIKTFIPTSEKIRYINQLLKVGFHTLDFGSFVSSKAIPQMRDTEQVVRAIDLRDTNTQLLAIVANVRGAVDAASFESISFLGFPLSISETFQQRNTNKSIVEALNTLEEIKNICLQKNKKLVTYISMGFGNPYGDPYSESTVSSFADILTAFGTDVISLADTIGAATPEQVTLLVASLTKQFPGVDLGVHLHASPNDALAKIQAAYEAGGRRFDGALNGLGGCPMANDDLVGNIATEQILTFLRNTGEDVQINEDALRDAMRIASEIFPNR